MITKWITSLMCGVSLIGVTLASALPASAEQAPDNSGPGVTRVSVIQGTAVVQRGDSNKQVAATANAPLLPGDYISTGASSRGELQFDGSSAVRLGGNVQARITNDDPNNRQLQLADGTIEVGLVRDTGPVQIDTPSVTVRASRAGDYRIAIGRDGSSWITTRRGSAEVVTPQRTYTLDPGRTLVARGSATNPSMTYTSEIGYDTFDDFNAKRDQTMVAALSASPNLNPDIAGYDNLGAYGQWQDVAGYGQAWVPTQSSGWSPYSNGSWTWEDGYGWTWVASEPWGWAPYHYGRWLYANGYGWAWVPPAYSSSPAWSPALVGFFGFGVGGPGWGVSVGFGYPNIGWYPLAPYWPYYSWYPGWAWTGLGWGWRGWGCCGYGWGWGGTRIVNVTNVTNIYRYFPHGGVHGTAIGNFQHGTVSGHTFAVNPHNIGGHVGTIHGAIPVTPTRDTLGFGGRAIGAPVSISKAFDSPRFGTINHSLSGSLSFDRQQKAVSQAIESHAHNNAPVSRDNTETRGSLGTRENALGGRENVTMTRQGDATGHQSAPADSWQRFNQTRGNEERGNSTISHAERPGSNGTAHASLANEGSREDGRTAGGSWSRFSSQRGNVSAPVSERGSYSRGDSYSRDSYGSSSSRDSYGSSYGRYSSQRNPYASDSRGAQPSYSRASYPSYARGSYPSYSRPSGSQPSYSRGSYPSYSRGISQPSYSHAGGYSAPHPAGGNGGGGGGSHGGGSHGGGRPPH